MIKQKYALNCQPAKTQCVPALCREYTDLRISFLFFGFIENRKKFEDEAGHYNYGSEGNA